MTKPKDADKWTRGGGGEHKLRSKILTCECGEKYVKTREGQITCIFCMNRVEKNQKVC